VSYHDPFCPEIVDDGHTPIRGLPMRSVDLNAGALAASDCVLVVTSHSKVDYQSVAEHAALVVDTRGVMRDYPALLARVVGLSGHERAAPVPPVGALG
jgi:UDP-N-acetyl-D-glucosamine dehydrogenase